MELDGAAIWRAVNLTIAISALVGMVGHTRHTWRRRSTRGRLFLQSHCILLLAIVVGSVENIAQDNPVGWRTAFISAGILWTAWAVYGTQDALTREEELRILRRKRARDRM